MDAGKGTSTTGAGLWPVNRHLEGIAVTLMGSVRPPTSAHPPGAADVGSAKLLPQRASGLKSLSASSKSSWDRTAPEQDTECRTFEASRGRVGPIQVERWPTIRVAAAAVRHNPNAAHAGGKLCPLQQRTQVRGAAVVGPPSHGTGQRLRDHQPRLPSQMSENVRLVRLRRRPWHLHHPHEPARVRRSVVVAALIRGWMDACMRPSFLPAKPSSHTRTHAVIQSKAATHCSSSPSGSISEPLAEARRTTEPRSCRRDRWPENRNSNRERTQSRRYASFMLSWAGTPSACGRSRDRSTSILESGINVGAGSPLRCAASGTKRPGRRGPGPTGSTAGSRPWRPRRLCGSPPASPRPAACRTAEPRGHRR